MKAILLMIGVAGVMVAQCPKLAINPLTGTFDCIGIPSVSGQSGYISLSGATSGSSGFSVPNVAGTAILYLLPSVAGTSGQVLSDNGAATCPTLPSGAPNVCHQLLWIAAGGGPPSTTNVLAGDGAGGFTNTGVDITDIVTGALNVTLGGAGAFVVRDTNVGVVRTYSNLGCAMSGDLGCQVPSYLYSTIGGSALGPVLVFNNPNNYGGISSTGTDRWSFQYGAGKTLGTNVMSWFAGGVVVGTSSTDPGVGQLVVDGLKTTGSATGKNVVCVDTATGKLYASSLGTSCLN